MRTKQRCIEVAKSLNPNALYSAHFHAVQYAIAVLRDESADPEYTHRATRSMNWVMAQETASPYLKDLAKDIHDHLEAKLTVNAT